MIDPTPEQIEAAAEAIRKVECRSALIADVDLPTYKARAALVAAAGAAVSRRTSNARVVTRGIGSDCATGVCPGWCSHLMWFCDQCSCEGGWGGTEESLTQLAAEHTCPPCLTSNSDPS